MALLESVEVRGFRSAAHVELEIGPVTALVGGARSGKSNLLRAIRALLDPEAPLGPADVSRDDADAIHVEARLDDGGRISRRHPSGDEKAELKGAPPALFLPADLRSSTLVDAPGAGEGGPEAARIFRGELAAAREGDSDAAVAGALLTAVKACSLAKVSGLVLLIEEPELFLRPQTQRYLYRQLRALAAAGNQIVYSTYAPAFLNVARLEELVLVRYDPGSGTQIRQPQPLEADEAFRIVSEFDAERSELFLARAAILVEGRTEKLVLPSVFQALGHDVDRDLVTIVECGGKSNIPVFARICHACELPFVVVHDRDADPGKEPIPAEVALNALIAEVAGPGRTIVLEPDFEAVAGLRGHSNKPERAWTHFSAPGVEVPESLVRAVQLALGSGGQGDQKT